MPKQCNEPGCKNNVFGKGFCRNHQYRRTDIKKTLKTSKISSKRKTTGELDLFKEMWNECSKRSFISGILIEEFSHHLFHHVLSKKDYPSLRLDKENIIVVTPHEHNLIHFGTEEQRKQYGYEYGWLRLEELKRNLKLKQNV